MSQVVVVLGGGPLSRRATAEVVAGATIIAADGGLDHAVDAGLRPTVLIGDLDSVSAHGKMWAYAHEAEIHEFPADKDVTDTELALSHAAAGDDTMLLVLGGGGERFDHALGTIAALGNPILANFESIRLLLDDTVVHIIHPGHPVSLDLPPYTLFSVLALHGPCHGVEVSGARWPLSDAVLVPSSTRGISNETNDLLHVAVADGVLTLVVP